MYNLIEYSDNYSDTSKSLCQFKSDKIEGNEDLTVDSNHIQDISSSFKYKSSLIGNLANNGRKQKVKIAVPLKYLSNFWRLIEIPLINCKVKLPLKWDSNCILSDSTEIRLLQQMQNFMFVLVLYQQNIMLNYQNY